MANRAQDFVEGTPPQVRAADAACFPLNTEKPAGGVAFRAYEVYVISRFSPKTGSVGTDRSPG
jgi:hypothetical protein